MAKKDNAVEVSEEAPVAVADRAVASPLIITPKDRVAFEWCLEVTVGTPHRSRIAFFEVDAYGIRARGRKVADVAADWLDAAG